VLLLDIGLVVATTIDASMKVPFALTQIFPKFDYVLLMTRKELSKVLENECHMLLERMG